MFKLLSLIIITLINGKPLYMDYQVQEDYVPILGYHDIEKGISDSLTVEITNFKEQIDYLTNNMSCNWITMERLAYYIEKGEKTPTNACIVNFDDGSVTQYNNALCTLNKHKVPATYYIAIDNIGLNQYYMTQKHLNHLYSIGHDMESHTLTHARLIDLSFENQEGEILGSKIELKNRGYNVSTFAYPYGGWNIETEEILKKSDFIFARDTSQRNSWKDIRSPTISYITETSSRPLDDDPTGYTEDRFNYLLHFYYIKPEAYNATELYNKIKYTGWWQFEDNYRRINGTRFEVAITSSSSVIPTDTSYAVLKLSKTHNEIETQFITKYNGSFTLDMLMYNSTENIEFKVKVDDIEYDVFVHELESEYALKYKITTYTWYNFYININNLVPGIHKLSIIKTSNNKLFLDKFRLFSNVNQDFSYKSYYKECDSNTDSYCVCENEDDFNWDNFLRNLFKSSLLLVITIIIVVILLCITYMCFNCKKSIDNKEKIEEQIEVITI